jgi:hypothetical protein
MEITEEEAEYYERQLFKVEQGGPNERVKQKNEIENSLVHPGTVLTVLEDRYLSYIGEGNFVYRQAGKTVLSMFKRSLMRKPDQNEVEIKKMPFTDLRYLPQNSTNLRVYGQQVLHWHFPNFSTLEIPRARLDQLVLVMEEQSYPLGKGAQTEIAYVANKSPGIPYYMFSCYTDRWHSFSHHMGEIAYMGPHYRVGHVEVVRGQFVSSHYQGQIYHEGQWQKVQRKSLWDGPDYGRGHAEGVILSLDGVEHRIKIYATHDLLVTDVDDVSIIVETAEGKYRFRYEHPEFQVLKGQIVEVVGTLVSRVRIDKYKAEVAEAYDRIEGSLLYGQFRDRIIKLYTSKIVRTQVKPEPRLIDDPLIMDAIERQGDTFTVVSNFSQYRPLDVVYTMQAMGVIIESTKYQMTTALNYNQFKYMYSGMPMQEPVSKLITSEGFDFSAIPDLELIRQQEHTIIEGVLNPDLEEKSHVMSYIDTLDKARLLVESADPKTYYKHTKICQAQLMPFSPYQCFACEYRRAVQMLYDEIANRTPCLNDYYYVGAKYGLNRRYFSLDTTRV